MSTTSEAYDRGVSHGWDAANYADAYGQDETRAAEATRRARDYYPHDIAARVAYVDGFAAGAARFDAGRYAETQRTYTVGLPVVVTVHDDGTVSYWIDTAETTVAVLEEYDPPAADLDAISRDHERRVAEREV